MPSVPNSGPAAPPPVWNAPPASGVIGPPGGFWLRFIALLIDGVIVSLAAGVLIGILAGLFAGTAGFSRDSVETLADRDDSPTLLFFGLLAVLLVIVGAWLYEAILTSSASGATWGKGAMGLRVLRADGTRLSFGRATARYFCKAVITPLLPLFIGYLMAAFTSRKQALHDFMADTVVVRAF